MYQWFGNFFCCITRQIRQLQYKSLIFFNSWQKLGLKKIKYRQISSKICSSRFNTDLPLVLYQITVENVPLKKIIHCNQREKYGFIV